MTTTTTAQLVARDVVVHVGATTILDGVNLEVTPGEVVAIIGPNGAGKSTLLRAVAGDIRVARGEIAIAGRSVRSWAPRALARHRAVLPQDTAVAFPFTVREIVEMGRAPWAGTPQAASDAAAVAQALGETETDQLAQRRYTTLSGGERSRAALARVLAQDTPVLLLDEPTAALDLRHQELVLQVARRRAATGVAVLIVLHDIDAAAAYADRIVLLSRGSVAASGLPQDVCRPDLLSATYGWEIDVMRGSDGRVTVRPRRDFRYR